MPDTRKQVFTVTIETPLKYNGVDLPGYPSGEVIKAMKRWFKLSKINVVEHGEKEEWK